ncbi:hypothetical protein PRBEI_2001744900 [Prionailurus iriomotensis]
MANVWTRWGSEALDRQGSFLEPQRQRGQVEPQPCLTAGLMKRVLRQVLQTWGGWGHQAQHQAPQMPQTPTSVTADGFAPWYLPSLLPERLEPRSQK